MVCKKRGFSLVLLVTFLIVVTSFSLAEGETGCYTFPGGDEGLYCQDQILKEDAISDCSDFDDCNINNHFSEGQSCLRFPECEEVLCSVDCVRHTLGWCEELGLREAAENGLLSPAAEQLKGKAIRAGERQEWCAPRCCKSGPYCSRGLVSKWDCQLGATRANAPFGSMNEDFECPDPFLFCDVSLNPASLSVNVYNPEGNIEPGVEVKTDTNQNALFILNKYLFEELTPRSYVISVIKDGFAPKSQQVTLREGEAAEIEFFLQEAGGAEVSGTVYAGIFGGEIISGATISWEEAGRTKTTTSDAEGKYTIPELSKQSYTFTASKSQFNPIEQTRVLIEGENIIDFTLTRGGTQGIRGTTFVEGIEKFGVIVNVDGRFGGVSLPNPEGHYEINLNPGTYLVSAIYRGEHSSLPVEITVVENEFLENIDLQLLPSTPECGLGTYKNVESLAGQPVLGEDKIRLNWKRPCPEVQSYQIRRYFCPGGTCQEEFELLSASALSFSKIDDEVEWGMTYQYEITAVYKDEFFQPVESPEPFRTGLIYVGDEGCKGKYLDNGLSKRFCTIENRQEVRGCEENMLISVEDCSQINSYCAPDGIENANCKIGGQCGSRGQGADPFGLYHNQEVCYAENSFCYYDYTNTIVDACMSCTETESCFNYKSQNACERNSCLSSQCAWVDATEGINIYAGFEDILLLPTTLETGKGYCTEVDYQNDDFCGLCGPDSPPSALFKNSYCTANVCSSLGRCFSDQDLSSCNVCGEEPTTQTNCYNYKTDLECTGAKEGFLVNEDGTLSFSEDQCGWKRCSWQGIPGGSGTCVKDGDENGEDDCPSGDGVCKADNKAPHTTIPSGERIISHKSPSITFTSLDERGLGTFSYCLTGTEIGEQDFCPEESFTVENFRKVNEDSISINLLEPSLVMREINGEPFKVKYYSKDKHFNQETMRETVVFIDNVLPSFEIQTEHVTNEDRTDLSVFIIGEKEQAVCRLKLEQKFPSGETQKRTIERESQERIARFDNLYGVHFNLTATCTDDSGNENSKSEWLVFDLEQKIDIVHPQIGQALETTTVSFEVKTTVAATCELRTVVPEQFVANFVPNGDLKIHKTEPISGFFEGGNYLASHKVVCRELLDPTKEIQDFFSFEVDFTPPDTTILLQEGLRGVRPTVYNWEEFFVESTQIDFECQSDGFGCDKTFYCLGFGCENRRDERYTEYTGSLSITEDTRICYYSTDLREGKINVQPFCGDITFSGYGLTLLRPKPYLFNEELFGISNTPQFNFEFFTKIPTTLCKFDFLPDFSYNDVPQFRILQGENNRYLFENFPGEVISAYPGKGGIKTLYLKCENFGGDVSPEHKINLEYDPSSPKIEEAFAEPKDIIEGTRTTLYVQTDDKTSCRYSDNSEGAGSLEYETMEFLFPSLMQNELKIQHEDIFNINFVGAMKEYNLSTQCLNGAGDRSEAEEINFRVDYSTEGNIIFLSPSGYIKDTNVTLKVQTNKNAICEFYPGNESKPFVTIDGTLHTSQMNGLEEKTHLFPVKCIIGDHAVENQIKFTIDNTPPKITNITDYDFTCNLNKIQFHVYTGEENITAADYALFEKPVFGLAGRGNITEGIIANGTVYGEQPFIINSPLIGEGRKYYVKARVADNAGNWGDFAESDGVLVVPINDSRCPTDGPKIEIKKINETCTESLVEIHCKDNASCDIKYGKHGTSTSCLANRTYSGGSIKFDQNGWLCYYAEGALGNNVSNTELVSFSDEDGDGISNSCDVCSTTSAGKSVNGEGCSPGEAPDRGKFGGPQDRNKDTDGDSLPDYWEMLYESSTCVLDFENIDSDSDGTPDGEEDYDLDGASNYVEFTSHTDPCLAGDKPINIEDPKDGPTVTPPQFTTEKPNILAWVFLIVGVLLVLGGIGYLLYYYKSGTKWTGGSSSSSLIGSPGRMPSSVVNKPLPAWKRKLIGARKIFRKKSAVRKRESLFSEFNKSSKEIPHIGKVLSSKQPHLPKLNNLAKTYSDHKEEIKPGLKKQEASIFSKLESITKQTKDKKIQEIASKKDAQDIFSKLREISKKRKQKTK
jgi:hypothetical protein